jgi:hypothetical protein
LTNKYTGWLPLGLPLFSDITALSFDPQIMGGPWEQGFVSFNVFYFRTCMGTQQFFLANFLQENNIILLKKTPIFPLFPENFAKN